MSADSRVFVLGAGFTKAFCPDAPLMTGDYKAEELLEKFGGFSHARRILELERGANPKGHINIERLLTRLQGGMPYDFEVGSVDEIRLLSTELQKIFLESLYQIKSESIARGEELAAFANYCVENQVNCVTFNHDDVLDRALWEVHHVRYIGLHADYWHPDGGYGFFCKPSITLIADTGATMDTTTLLLFKLHGSINWRLKRGSIVPFVVDEIVHHEQWYWPNQEPTESELQTIEDHLEPEPLIVAPVLTKTSLNDQPILRLVWAGAYKALQDAQEVTFVGYSLPVTDLASATLFREALVNLPTAKVRVVNRARSAKDKDMIMRAYRSVFPTIRDKQFDFSGTLKWAKSLTVDA